jgi:hypothetical protein
MHALIHHNHTKDNDMMSIKRYIFYTIYTTSSIYIYAGPVSPLSTQPIHVIYTIMIRRQASLALNGPIHLNFM